MDRLVDKKSKMTIIVARIFSARAVKGVLRGLDQPMSSPLHVPRGGLTIFAKCLDFFRRWQASKIVGNSVGTQRTWIDAFMPSKARAAAPVEDALDKMKNIFQNFSPCFD